MYRVTVTATTIDESKESAAALVYPTSMRFPGEAESAQVAQIDLNSFQEHGLFKFVVCNTSDNRLPRGVDFDDVANAVKTWVSSVQWEKANGDNIIRVEAELALECMAAGEGAEKRNQVIFYNRDRTRDLCGGRDSAGCWEIRSDLGPRRCHNPLWMKRDVD